MKLEQIDPPADTLLAPYAALEGYYTDCFEVACARDVTLRDYITAFYTQPLFAAERVVLRIAARAPSSDADVAALASGEAAALAVWTVEGRSAHDILLKDKSGRTCSWLQAVPGHLRFGSVVVPVPGRGGTPTLGPVFHSLSGAHKVYSRALLSGAARRLDATTPP